MNQPTSVFRRHNDGTVTDTFEDAAVWVRDGEATSVRDLRDPDVILDSPHDYAGIRAYFLEHEPVEGLLFVHPDGREASVTRQDFGL